MAIYKAMIVDEDNQDKCCEILEVDELPRLVIEQHHWLVWDSTFSKGYKLLLPHKVFFDKFVSVENRGDYHVVDRR